MESLSLSKLNTYLRRVISLNFQDSLWISAEILSLKERNGHFYLELTEKDEFDNIAAQNTAVIWKNTYESIQQSFSFHIKDILSEGNFVRLLVNVDYSVKYGLKLFVQNIDPEYTYGKIAQTRLKTIERLKLEGIWQKNKNCLLPKAIRSIFVIASKDSAGFKDFENHLLINKFNYQFNITLFDVAVQGIHSVNEICSAFRKIKDNPLNYDIIVLIRGGGSKLDLLDFDSYDIAKEISLSDIIVLTGIGHLIDESIADYSAFQSLKTPTAVAEYILNINREFEIEISQIYESILKESNKNIQQYQLNLDNRLDSVIDKSRKLYLNNYKDLHELKHSVIQSSFKLCYHEMKHLATVNLIIETNDPETIFDKGYSLSTIDGVLLLKANSLEIGDEIITRFKSGKVTSKITKKWEIKN